VQNAELLEWIWLGQWGSNPFIGQSCRGEGPFWRNLFPFHLCHYTFFRQCNMVFLDNLSLIAQSLHALYQLFWPAGHLKSGYNVRNLSIKSV
jgi:hypothetical protein